MKKNKLIIMISILFFLVINVSASSGKLKQDSTIECQRIYYGNHGNPSHWHIVEKKDGIWVSISKEVDIPSCYIKPINEKEKVQFHS